MPDNFLLPDLTLYLTCTDLFNNTPWDFDEPAKRAQARQHLRTQKPLMLIGSPVCTVCCAWQRLNRLRRPPKVYQEELRKACVHLEFLMSLYKEQIEGGCLFIHEHPKLASSWMED